MSDHSSVQEAETAAAGKVREISEAAIRLLLQQRQQSTVEDKQIKLFDDFYQVYRDRGVDRKTAKAAAADAALGLGAKDSPMMQQAEAQIIRKAQQSETYRAKSNVFRDQSNPIAERKQAAKEAKSLEADFGIADKPVEEKVKVINQLDPPQREPEQQPTAQTESAQPTVSSGQAQKPALRQNYQSAYERQGAKPETAKAASYEVVNKEAGAADGPAVAQAHQEIRQHQILKDMYQGVYKKNGVSPEIASQAADQLARGNGANRSNAVRQAHNQALANIAKAQQVSTAQEAPSSQVPRPITKVQKEQASEARQTQDRPAPKADRPIQAAAAQASDPLWQQHSPTEQGIRKPNIDYENSPRTNDVRFAYNALSVEASKEDIKQSIIRNSSEAKNNANPEQYADQSIGQAEQALVTTRNQQQQSSIATEAQPEAAQEERLPERVTGEEAKPKPEQSPPQSIQPTTEPIQPQNSVSSQEAALQSGSSQKAAPIQAQPEAEATRASAPQQKLSSQELYDTFSETNKTGVAAQQARKNPRLNDRLVAQKALSAGHDPSEVQTAIAEHSPHAQTLSGSKSYARRTVGKAQENLGKDSKETQADQGQKSERGQSREKARRLKDQTRTNQSGKKAVAQRQKTQKKVKSKSRGQGMEI